jgi:hypothetical protein
MLTPNTVTEAMAAARLQCRCHSVGGADAAVVSAMTRRVLGASSRIGNPHSCVQRFDPPGRRSFVLIQ